MVNFFLFCIYHLKFAIEHVFLRRKLRFFKKLISDKIYGREKNFYDDKTGRC